MISRKTTLFVSNIISKTFIHQVKESYNNGRFQKTVCRVDADRLKDFLFEFNVSGFVLEELPRSWENEKYLKDSILQIHTGIFYSTYGYKKFENLGQEDIKNIILGILQLPKIEKYYEELNNLLKMDGYIYENGNLYTVNIDIQNKVDIILEKYRKLLFNKEVEFNEFYNNMNEHYENSKWSDSIHNGRKLYEIVLSECAIKFSNVVLKDNKTLENEKPVKIREYLETNNFFSEDESNIVRYYYKYMSNIGSHPKLALKEQADFSRIITLNTILYALNRMEMFIN